MVLFDWIIIYIMLNTVTYFIVAIDKYRAIKRKWRISEKTLFLLSIFGGALGVYVGMMIFRHKTKHLKFKIGIPIIIIIQIIIFIMLFFNLIYKFTNIYILS